ncbi:MAG: PAS domain S-box protein [Bacteroidales bacterium]|nr:PAS domain S-box protein [Bacteroidales bacterium]
MKELFEKDITERKQPEAQREAAIEALRRAEENFRRTLDDSPLGVRIVSAEGETIYANRAILDIYGYDSIEEIRTTPIKNRYTPESYAEFQIRYDKRRQGEESPSEYEICIVKKNGEVRRLQVFRKEVLWNNERQYQVLYHDITEHKRAEETLAQEQYLMRTLMDNLPDHIYFKDHASRIIRINKAMSQFLGLNDSKQAFGKTDFDFFTEEHARQTYEDEQTIIRTGQMLSIEEKRIHPDRPDTWVSTIKLPLRDKEGNIIGTFGISRDITDRKSEEEELELRISLEQLHQLTQYREEIIENERMAISRELHDSLGQALTAVKIDLGTIIQNVSDREEVVLKINKVSALVSDTIKTVQRLTAKLRPPLIDDLGLEAAIELYTKEFAQRNRVEVFLDLEPGIAISPDASLTIFRIMQESLTNIARHSGATRVNIGLSKTGDNINFRISDNGIGLSEDKIKSKKSFGIMSMKERAASVGGTFDIYREDNCCTVVNLIFPLNHK